MTAEFHSPKPVIGIDLGGTKVAAGLVRGPEVLNRHEEATPRTAPALLDVLERIVRRYDEHTQMPLPIGLGVPEPVKAGQSTFYSTLPDLNHTRLEVELARRLGRPVPIEHDANLAALAEFQYGASQGALNSVYLTWSTGIGCGVILGGRLHAGRTGMAGEVGHCRVSPYGPMDGSGTTGTLEARASGAALARDASVVFGRPVTVPELMSTAATEGHASAILQQAAEHISVFLHNLHLLLDPDCVALGGGLFNEAERLLPRIETARQHSGALAEFTPLIRSVLGRDAGVIGAAIWALNGRPGGH